MRLSSLSSYSVLSNSEELPGTNSLALALKLKFEVVEFIGEGTREGGCENISLSISTSLFPSTAPGLTASGTSLATSAKEAREGVGSTLSFTFEEQYGRRANSLL